jgi:hypothetical protein
MLQSEARCGPGCPLLARLHLPRAVPPRSRDARRTAHPTTRSGRAHPVHGHPALAEWGLLTAARCNAVQPASFGASTLRTCPSTIMLTTRCVSPRLAASRSSAAAGSCSCAAAGRSICAQHTTHAPRMPAVRRAAPSSCGQPHTHQGRRVRLGCRRSLARRPCGLLRSGHCRHSQQKHADGAAPPRPGSSPLRQVGPPRLHPPH